MKVKKVLLAQSCPTLCNPMNCTPWGSFVHGILQARILEWIAIFFSRWSSWPRDWTRVSCIAGQFFTIWATKKAVWEITVRALSMVFLWAPWEMLFTRYGMSNQSDQVWLCNSITSCAWDFSKLMNFLQPDFSMVEERYTWVLFEPLLWDSVSPRLHPRHTTSLLLCFLNCLFPSSCECPVLSTSLWLRL